MSPTRAEICPSDAINLLEKTEPTERRISQLIHMAEERLGYPVEGIQVEEDGQTAHLVIRGGEKIAVLTDNGGNEVIICGEARQKGFFTPGWYYSVNWGGTAGEREYVNVYHKRRGSVLSFPDKGGFFLRISDLREVAPEKKAGILKALEKVTNQE